MSSRSKSNRRSKPSAPARNKPEDSRQVVTQEMLVQQRSGPLPDAAELQNYEQVLPGAAERIVAMAEAQAEHRRAIEAKGADPAFADMAADRREARYGQWFGLIIGLTTVICGSVTAVLGAEVAGGVIGTTGVAGLVAVFVLGRKRAEPSD